MGTLARDEVTELDLTDNSLLFEIITSYYSLYKYSLELKFLLHLFYNLIPECPNWKIKNI